MSELSNEMKRLRDSIIDAIRSEETINSETVTNEVVLEDDQDFHEEYGYLAFSEDEADMFEAEYQGRKVKLNKPMRGDVKKFKVYVKNDKGNVIKVSFGDPNMKIKFHMWSFTLILKNIESLSPPQIEQIVLRLDDTPNVLPLKINRNIIIDINGPDIYQGQELKIKSIFIVLYLFFL